MWSLPGEGSKPWLQLLLSKDLVHAKSPWCTQPCPLAPHCAAETSLGCAEPMTVCAGLQCLQTSNPAWWTWPSWRTAQCPWSAWPQDCLLLVSWSSPLALAPAPLGPLSERSGSIVPYSSAPCFPPDITWYKGHEQLLAGLGRTLSRDGKHLEIQHAQLSDAGSYHCVASNVAGVTERWYSLQVNGESAVSGGMTEAA